MVASAGNVSIGDEGVDALMALFNEVFEHTENTVLMASADEPLYLPAEKGMPARILFAHGFFASALHEIAHWCVAGRERRQQVDLGYWYAPDGRTPEQQREFEQVEIKPQALEWIFNAAAGRQFRTSCDNLVHGPYDADAFCSAVHAEVLRRIDTGLPARAAAFTAALAARYNPGWTFQASAFDRATLR